MHNYNPPHKYSLRTRMGNWSEEWDLLETKYFYFKSDARNISGRRMMGYLVSIKKSMFFLKVIRV